MVENGQVNLNYLQPKPGHVLRADISLCANLADDSGGKSSDTTPIVVWAQTLSFDEAYWSTNPYSPHRQCLTDSIFSIWCFYLRLSSSAVTCFSFCLGELTRKGNQSSPHETPKGCKFSIFRNKTLLIPRLLFHTSESCHIYHPSSWVDETGLGEPPVCISTLQIC